MIVSANFSLHWSRHLPRLPFAMIAGDSLLPGFVGTLSPAAAAQLRVEPR